MHFTGRIIGVDESGKGDFFGPLVVAAFGADHSESESLRQLGVRDGKLISENRLLAIARTLRTEYPHALVIVDPAEYNRRYGEIKNLNKLLADCHADAIGALAERYPADLAVCDQFGKTELISDRLSQRDLRLPLHQIVRGEQVVQVAAASIIARAVFIERLHALSREFGLELPRGAAAQVDTAGRDFVKRHGSRALSEVAKVHFKNFARATQSALPV